MKKLEKKDISYLLWGLFWLLAGLCLIIFNQAFVDNLVYLVGAVLVALGLFKIPEAFLMRHKYPQMKNKFLHCLEGLLHIVGGSLVIALHELSALWLAKIVGLYQILIGLVSLFNYHLLRVDRVPYRFNQLMIAFVNLFFGWSSFFLSQDVKDTLIRLGIYLIFIGFTSINDGRRILLSMENEHQLKRRMRFSVPVIFTMLLPWESMAKINRFINDEFDLTTEIEAIRQLEANKNIKTSPNLKVFIHTAEKGFNTVGHCDLSYKGVVYAFGNYDVDSARFFGMVGDGVFVETEEADYLANCLAIGKTIFEYQLVLDEEQQRAFEEKLSQIKQMTIAWQPETPSQKASYMGSFQASYGANLFKFTSSRFKTYFVLGTNCVLLADELIGTSGLDIIRMAGILAPGTYYDYFEKEFENKASIVVGRKVHHRQLQPVAA